MGISLPKNIDYLTTGIIKHLPHHHKFLEASLLQLPEEEIRELEDYIDFCLTQEVSIDFLIDSYITIVNDTFSEQLYFMKEKHYRYNSFSEVADKVYFNKEYMQKYMFGLAVTAFLWPNHAEIHRFFLKTLPLNKNGKYLEIGPGHGYYFMKAMKLSSYENFTGIDISQTSIDMTKSITEYFFQNVKEKTSFIVKDFLENKQTENIFDAIVMGEVLEHVENPLDFLNKIVSMSNSETHIYLTTCVNAPAIDHIYLYRTTEEVENMINASGMIIKDKHYAPYAGKTIEESEQQMLPINVAYTARVA